MNGIRALLFFLILSMTFQFGCGSLKLPPKEIHVVVRESNSGKLVEGALMIVLNKNDQIVSTKTDALGHVLLDVKKLSPLSRKQVDLDSYHLVCHHTFTHNSSTVSDTVRIPMNNYLSIYDLYLTDPNATPKPVAKVADMHYHVSLKAQNYFGVDLYEDDIHRTDFPSNLTWSKFYNKLCVLQDGKYRKPYFGEIDWEKVSQGKRSWQRKKAKMETLLNQKWVRPKGKSNSLKAYTQATNPHIKEGSVYLAFNAITPFEHGLANDGKKRFVSTNLKSGAPKKWLRRIGHKKDKLAISHWDNFLSEHRLIANQDTTLNNFRWKFLKSGDELKNGGDSVPFIVNVVEGAHILHHKAFPHAIGFDLTRRTDRQNRKLFDELEAKGLLVSDNDDIYGNIISQQSALNTGRQLESRKAWKDKEVQLKISLIEDERAIVDKIYMKEIRDNVTKLKALDPPIHMVTPAHLSYNGMMGHAPAIDDGSFFTNLIARKVYAIRVSDDPLYQGQWKGLFYSVPGPNKFGKAVLCDLASDTNGHKILLDLKHMDFIGRKFFFDSVMVQYNVPPICSHCAATGLSGSYYSPFNDEYSILRAPFTTKYYPFSINLFDGEIADICENDGIIGIPLEQRVLGGYINKKELRNYKIDAGGNIDSLKQSRTRRYKNISDLFRCYAKAKNVHVVAATDYTRQVMGVQDDRVSKKHFDKKNKVLKITCEEYISAEPFIQNLFYLIDHSNKSGPDAWKHICIGSDLDGIIDPLDICPTASQYPHFKERLRQFIPIFLEIRKINAGQQSVKTDYFDHGMTLDEALDYVFYQSLKSFTEKYFNGK